MSYPYPYGYGYPYGYYYPYYSLPLLSNEYKLAGLYNELDELDEVEAQNALRFNRGVKFDMSMNPGLHMQLKHKNHELVQHIVGKNVEIEELRELLKKHNIPMDASMNHKSKDLYPYPYPYSYPYPYPYLYRDADCSMNRGIDMSRHRPHPHPHPHPHPFWPPCDGEMSETHTVHAAPANHIIIPRALAPNTKPSHYIVPPHVHIKILPCVLPPTLPKN